MSKGWGKAFAKAWLTKLKDKHIADADKNWTKINKALKAAFTPYDTAVQAEVRIQQVHLLLLSPLYLLQNHQLPQPVRMVLAQPQPPDCSLAHPLWSHESLYHHGETLLQSLQDQGKLLPHHHTQERTLAIIWIIVTLPSFELISRLIAWSQGSPRITLSFLQLRIKRSLHSLTPS